MPYFDQRTSGDKALRSLDFLRADFEKFRKEVQEKLGKFTEWICLDDIDEYQEYHYCIPTDVHYIQLVDKSWSRLSNKDAKKIIDDCDFTYDKKRGVYRRITDKNIQYGLV
jgi:hypothetical protein